MTLVSRHYLYVSASRPNVENDRAVFAFPPIQAVITPTCQMRFYYHMLGAHLGKLTIYKRTEVMQLMYCLCGRGCAVVNVRFIFNELGFDSAVDSYQRL